MVNAAPLGVNELSTDCSFELKKGEVIGWMSEAGESLNRRSQHNGIDASLLKILCCPETHQGLRIAEATLLEKLNDRIAAGKLQNRAGRPVTERLESGLIRVDGQCLYPVRHDIPILLVDEAIPLTADGPD